MVSPGFAEISSAAICSEQSFHLGPAREHTFQQLLARAKEPLPTDGGELICLVAPPGGGKTFFLRHLQVSLEASGITSLFFETEPPVTGSLLRELARRLASWAPVTSEQEVNPPDSWDFLETIWPRVAEKIRARGERGVVLIIDDLEEFEPTGLVRGLSWLRALLSAPLRVMVGCAPGPVADDLARLPSALVVELPPLDDTAAEAAFYRFCTRPDEQTVRQLWETLSQKRNSLGEPAWQWPLWLALAGWYLSSPLVEAEADRRSEAVSRQAFNGERLRQEAAQLAAEVEPLCWHVLAACESRWGRGWVQACLGLLAISRGGLRESDLAAIAPKAAKLLEATAAKRAWEGDTWAQFCRCLPGWFVQRNSAPVWDFSHKLLRAAVKSRYLRDLQVRQRLHTFLAYHLRNMPAEDLLRQRELLFHLAWGDERSRTAQHLAGELCPTDKRAALIGLEAFVLSQAGEVPNPGVSWLASLLLEPSLTPAQIASLCTFLYEDFLSWISVQLDSASLRRLLEAIQQSLAEVLRYQPDNADWQAEQQKIAARLARIV
jgi:hypothetical protein